MRLNLECACYFYFQNDEIGTAQLYKLADDGLGVHLTCKSSGTLLGNLTLTQVQLGLIRVRLRVSVREQWSI